jgi:hypothetical protein
VISCGNLGILDKRGKGKGVMKNFDNIINLDDYILSIK